MDDFDATAIEGSASDIVNNWTLLKGIAAHSTRPLPPDYTLGNKDVFCGRGCRCFNHIGNQRFRAIVESQLDRYSKAKTKMDKTVVICEVVNFVRANSPDGGFVKKDPLTGRFFEVGDFLAREKTSQAFRDALHEKYKSSNMKKKTRRSLLKREKRDAMTRNTNSYGTLLSSSSNSSLTCSPSSTTSTYVNSDMSTSSRLNNHQFQAKCTIEQESSYINHKNDDNTNKVGGSDEKRVFQNSSWNMMNDQDEGPICGITQSYERKYESNTYNNKMFYSDKRFSITTSFIPIDDYSERCDNQYSRLMNSTGSDYRTNKWANNNSATYSNNHPGQQSYSNNSIDTELDGLRKKFLLDECFVDEYRRKQSIEATNDNANELLFRNDPTQYQHERQPRRQSIVVSPAFDLI